MSPSFQLLKTDCTAYRLMLLICLALVGFGYAAAHSMETQGHWISGMNNQVAWGLPHVFAIGLILAASGAINVASMSSALGVKEYTVWSRLSALLAICLLIGGLVVLVLDLGRPERLIIAMTHYNFKSIFAWNIFLYTGFAALVIAYLWSMYERHANAHTARIGVLVLVWRLILTSGTGSIFGFLVARQLYQSAMLVPMFIALSLIIGTAVFSLLAVLVGNWAKPAIELALLQRLGRLLGLFIGVELLLVAAFYMTGLYDASRQQAVYFVLFDGGWYSLLFWVGQVLIGALLPLFLLFAGKELPSTIKICFTYFLAIVGAVCQLYITIIGGQVLPLSLFPGKQVSSSFYDGVVASYIPSMPELLLGLGGVSLSFLILFGLLRILPALPENRTTFAAAR